MQQMMLAVTSDSWGSRNNCIYSFTARLKFFANIAQDYIFLALEQNFAEMSLPLQTVEELKRVILCIDNFTVRIQCPNHSGDTYFCGRPGKSCVGVNVQYVVDRRGWIRHIVTGIPGSSHDATAI